MFFCCCFLKAQSDKQNRALEEQLNDHKYQVRKETQFLNFFVRLVRNETERHQKSKKENTKALKT